MSLPKFPDTNDILNREEALCAIITAIACEEAALAEILKAESQKLVHAIDHLNTNCHEDMKLLLKFNQSISEMIGEITDVQLILKSKLQIAVSQLPQQPCPPGPPCPPPHPPKPPPHPPKPPPHPPKPPPHPPKPPTPPHPPKPPTPDPPCPPPHPPKKPFSKHSSEFVVLNKCQWQPNTTVKLEQQHVCGNDIKLVLHGHDYLISLPHSGKYQVELFLKLLNKAHVPTEIELACESHHKKILARKYFYDEYYHKVIIDDSMILPLDGVKKSLLSIKLLSSQPLEIEKGTIVVRRLK